MCTPAASRASNFDSAVPVPPEDGEHAVAICEAAYRSARDDRPADVDPA